MTQKPAVYDQILDIAEAFTQTQGYNAFSYRDIAEKVGIKTSSIHYYFPNKADLGKAVVKRHIEMLCNELDHIIHSKSLSARKKLESIIDGIIAKTYMSGRKMCLGGMLASDVSTLPESIQKEVRIFFDKLEESLKTLLTQAAQQREFVMEKKQIKNVVLLILMQLEGALLLARLYQDEGFLAAARKDILARLPRD